MKAKQTLTATQLKLMQQVPQRTAVSLGKMGVPIVGKAKGVCCK
jgi:hypothetical protein